MKKLIIFIVFAILLVGCASKPEIVDNGQPGQIKVTVYLDENRNGKMDENETGLAERVGISQDISCPAGSMDKVTEKQTDSNGEAVFRELDPGVYCVMYMGSSGTTTKLTVEVYLSSEQEAKVAFGLAE